MTHENNLMTVSQFDGNAYKNSQAAEQTLNAAILRAEIATKSFWRSLTSFTPMMSR